MLKIAMREGPGIEPVFNGTKGRMASLLGRRIRELRKARKLSQEELAEMLGESFDQTVISRIEVRENYEPGSYTLYRIAKALDTTMDALLDGVVEINPVKLPARAPASAEMEELRKMVGTLARNQAALTEAVQSLRAQPRTRKQSTGKKAG